MTNEFFDVLSQENGSAVDMFFFPKNGWMTIMENPTQMDGFHE